MFFLDNLAPAILNTLNCQNSVSPDAFIITFDRIFIELNVVVAFDDIIAFIFGNIIDFY